MFEIKWKQNSYKANLNYVFISCINFQSVLNYHVKSYFQQYLNVKENSDKF